MRPTLSTIAATVARYVVVITLGALMLATQAFGAARRPGRVRAETWSAAFTLQPDQNQSSSGLCPHRAPVSLSPVLYANSSALDGDIALTGFGLYGARGSYTAVRDLGQAPVRVVAGVLCSDLKVRRVARTAIVAAAGETVLAFSCPRSAPQPVSGFAGPNTTAGDGQLLVTRSLPAGRTWRIGLANVSGQPLPAYAGAECASRTHTIVRVHDVDVVQPGQGADLGELCPKRAPQAIGGFFGPGSASAAGQIALTESYAYKRRTWATTVRGLGATPEPYEAGAICVA